MTASACPVCEGAALPLAAVRGADYLRCPECAAVHLDPSRRPDAAAERARYLLHRNDPDDPGYLAHLNRLAAPLLARLPRPSDGLDYGSGPADTPALPRLLSAAGHRVARYDPFFHPDEAALARRHDFIAVCETAEHFHHPAREFARLAALLVPGGLLAVLTEPPPPEPAAFARWHYLTDPTHVVFYAPATFAWFAQAHELALDLPAPGVAIFAKGDCSSRASRTAAGRGIISG